MQREKQRQRSYRVTAIHARLHGNEAPGRSARASRAGRLVQLRQGTGGEDDPRGGRSSWAKLRGPAGPSPGEERGAGGRGGGGGGGSQCGWRRGWGGGGHVAVATPRAPRRRMCARCAPRFHPSHSPAVAACLFRPIFRVVSIRVVSEPLIRRGA